VVLALAAAITLVVSNRALLREIEIFNQPLESFEHLCVTN
jgi:hypothetical protein